MPPRKRSKPNPPKAEAEADTGAQSQPLSSTQGAEPQLPGTSQPSSELNTTTEKVNGAEATENAKDGASAVSASSRREMPEKRLTLFSLNQAEVGTVVPGLVGTKPLR